jgi:hypothetical protein
MQPEVTKARSSMCDQGMEAIWNPLGI